MHKWKFTRIWFLIILQLELDQISHTGSYYRQEKNLTGSWKFLPVIYLLPVLISRPAITWKLSHKTMVEIVHSN